MRNSALASLALVATVVCASAGQKPPSSEKSGQVILHWLGTAGWEISDGPTVILIDPYVSRIFGPQPPGRTPYIQTPEDKRPLYGWDDVATPDPAAIDTHVKRADFVLVTHTHYDHVLDVPQIALKTHATVMGTESTENVCGLTKYPKSNSLLCAAEKTMSSALFLSR